MEVHLSDLFDLYQLPSGRAWVAAERVKAVEEAADFPEILKLADAVIARARETRDMERRYRQGKPAPAYAPEASDLDSRIDRALGGLLTAIRAHADVFDDDLDDPRARDAAVLEQELFPRGANAITLLNYVAEHKTVGLLLEQVAPGGPLAAHVDKLGLRHFVDRLATLNESFGRAINRPEPPAGPTWDQVRQARATLNDAVLSLVARTIGTFHGTDEQSTSKRSAILAPIMHQQRILAREYARRRSSDIPDIDPSTGEPDPEPTPTA